MGLEELEAEQGTLVNDQDQLQTEIRQLERQMQATRIHADAVLDTYQKVSKPSTKACSWEGMSKLPLDCCQSHVVHQTPHQSFGLSIATSAVSG